MINLTRLQEDKTRAETLISEAMKLSRYLFELESGRGVRDRQRHRSEDRKWNEAKRVRRLEHELRKIRASLRKLEVRVYG